MTRTVQIHIGEAGVHVATLRHETVSGREHSTLEYGDEWLTHAQNFSIDRQLPLQPGPQLHRAETTGSVFHGAIADTEPDGWARRVIASDYAAGRLSRRERGTPAQAQLSALDLLFKVDDAARIGALRFADDAGAYQGPSATTPHGLTPAAELARTLGASRAVERHTETAADLEFLRGRGTSLGGVRPKCSIRDDDGHLAIGKFPSVTDTLAVAKAEVLALQLAQRAGITAATARLVWSEGTPVALIRRFDRDGDQRLMYVSAATMVAAESAEPGEHCYTDLADALRTHGARPRADIEELWRRIAFSILITNVDDHLRNHGFVHVAAGAWRLSPAFDINPFPGRQRELKTWIAPDTGGEASMNALMSAAPYFQLSAGRASAIVGEVEQAVATWRHLGAELGMTPAELDDYSEAFEHPERDAARAISRPA